MGTDFIGNKMLKSSTSEGTVLSDVLDDIRLSTNAIEDMLRNCNIYQLLEEKKFELEKHSFYLSDMLQEVDAMVRLQLKGLHLHFKVVSDIPDVVIGNSQLLAHFFVYVILNCARRSGAISTVHIDVKKIPTADSKHGGIETVVFNITDSGDTIGDIEAAEMFSAFSTLETCNNIDTVSY